MINITITAKFNSICPICGQKIFAGEKVNWEKGQKAKHIDCNASNPIMFADKLLEGKNAKWISVKNTKKLIELIPNAEYTKKGEFEYYFFSNGNLDFSLKVSPVNNAGYLKLQGNKEENLSKKKEEYKQQIIQLKQEINELNNNINAMKSELTNLDSKYIEFANKTIETTNNKMQEKITTLNKIKSLLNF